jgi:propionyl-CoA carboxylase alpha chain
MMGTTANATSDTDKFFDRVLIANRGEIAERVIKTCDKLGIETVAIYSTADAQARFVQLATHSYCVGPPAASDSYLNVPAVLDVIDKSGAQAVHPGYGFLSENAQFASTITDLGITWLGPPPHAVQEMGDKLLSKQLAERAGVSTVPGHESPVTSLDEALHICNHTVTYPVLVKALAGGGGKGMRVCYSDQDVKDAWEIAKSEALKFFSDDRLLIEKYIENPHHIEFQVLCDRNADTVIVFPERECSIQRRNQKVIEETPSPLLSPETRAKMAEQVVRLCKTVGYESAGTVEFLVDEQQNFYFLECNSRLQVEHPVSEAVCGVDLVEGMLSVGAGKGIPKEFKMIPRQPVLPHKGHAMEARVYAEDPLRNYLPSTGPLRLYLEPTSLMKLNTPERYLRIDSGVCQGHIVSPHYDPMISKVVSYAPTRKESISLLSQALEQYVIDGVQHNAELLQSVLRHDEFQKGNTPTSFLPRNLPDFAGAPLTPVEEAEFVAAATVIAQARRQLRQEPPLAGDNHRTTVICKLGGQFSPAFRVELSDNSAVVTSVDTSATETVRLDPRAPLQMDGSYRAHLTLNGKSRTIQVMMEEDTGEIPMQMYGADRHVLVQSEREYELCQHMLPPEIPDTANLVQSPMPGTLIRLSVSEGDSVVEGQELCVVEAMKMQNILRSPRSGVIAACKVKPGESVKSDQVIIEFEHEEEGVEEAAASA